MEIGGIFFLVSELFLLKSPFYFFGYNYFLYLTPLRYPSLIPGPVMSMAIATCVPTLGKMFFILLTTSEKY